MKIITGGKFAKYPKPPTGTIITCACKALLEVTDEEPNAIPDYDRKWGWGHKIPCPQCHQLVFVPFPSKKIKEFTSSLVL